jgi:Leucine-rich repeat (LRR) protein
VTGVLERVRDGLRAGEYHVEAGLDPDSEPHLEQRLPAFDPPLPRQERLYTARRMSTLAPLESLPALQRLSTDLAPGIDLGPLAGLRRLRDLQLGGPTTLDLGPLAGLRRLRDLQLGGPTTLDLAPLRGLPIERLRLHAVDLPDPDPLGDLAELRSLRTLTLTGSAVTDVAPLENHPALRDINLSGNPVTDLGVLSTLPLGRVVLDLAQWRALRPAMAALRLATPGGRARPRRRPAPGPRLARRGRSRPHPPSYRPDRPGFLTHCHENSQRFQCTTSSSGLRAAGLKEVPKV